MPVIRRGISLRGDMRLPLIPSVESRDGTSNKDARMSNALKESENGVDFACVRPSLQLVADTTGDGNGMIYFDTLISVFGGNVVYSESLTLIDTVVDSRYDFVKGES